MQHTTSCAAERLNVAAQLHAPDKYPRMIVFIDELPKTATGKFQRFGLGGMHRERLAS